MVRWPLQPLQPLQKTQLQPPFAPSVDSLCHPWFTTTILSYRFPIFETSATALCGTTGAMVMIIPLLQSFLFSLLLPLTIGLYIPCYCYYSSKANGMRKTKKNSLFGIDPGLSRRMNWCCLHCSLGPHFFCGDETGSTANPPKHRQIKDNKVIIRISGDHMHEYAISYIVTSSYITMSKLSPKICTLTKTPKVLSAVMQGTCGTSGG